MGTRQLLRLSGRDPGETGGSVPSGRGDERDGRNGRQGLGMRPVTVAGDRPWGVVSTVHPGRLAPLPRSGPTPPWSVGGPRARDGGRRSLPGVHVTRGGLKEGDGTRQERNVRPDAGLVTRDRATGTGPLFLGDRTRDVRLFTKKSLPTTEKKKGVLFVPLPVRSHLGSRSQRGKYFVLPNLTVGKIGHSERILLRVNNSWTTYGLYNNW